MTTQEELRKAARDLRVRPVPLADFIPLLLRAADVIDEAEALIRAHTRGAEPDA
jgi:hypothetical protein